MALHNSEAGQTGKAKSAVDTTLVEMPSVIHKLVILHKSLESGKCTLLLMSFYEKSSPEAQLNNSRNSLFFQLEKKKLDIQKGRWKYKIKTLLASSACTYSSHFPFIEYIY